MTGCLAPARYRYSVYGVRVTSDFPFEFPSDAEGTAPAAPLAHVEFVEGADRDFQPFVPLRSESDDTYFVCRPIAGGPTYLRWVHWYEFSVAADGSRVACRPLNGCDRTVLQNFLFGQVLAVALVHQGLEPLHTAVARLDDGAIGFLGDCTFGKSTILASFVEQGYRVVTDDMLIVERRAGEPHAVPGSGRIKLLPDSAGRFLKGSERGTPVNPMTAKRSFVLDDASRHASVPLRALYVLPDPDERDAATSIDILPASRSEMLRELVKHTFTVHLVDRDRIARQFDAAAQLAAEVDGFRLRYPTGLNHLPAVRERILEHALTRTARNAS